MLKIEHLKGIELLPALLPALVVGVKAFSRVLDLDLLPKSQSESPRACPRLWIRPLLLTTADPSCRWCLPRFPNGGRRLAAGGALPCAVAGPPSGGSSDVQQPLRRGCGREEAGVAPVGDPGAGVSCQNSSSSFVSPAPLM